MTDSTGDAASIARVVPDDDLAAGFPAGVLRDLAEAARVAPVNRVAARRPRRAGQRAAGHVAPAGTMLLCRKGAEQKHDNYKQNKRFHDRLLLRPQHVLGPPTTLLALPETRFALSSASGLVLSIVLPT